MIVIALWIFFALFMSLVVNMLMGILYPTENVTDLGTGARLL